MSANLKTIINHISIILLVFFIGSRGVVPAPVYEGYIWFLGVFYLLQGDWKVVHKKIKNQKWVLPYFLCFFIFCISILISLDFSGFNIIYSFSQFFPFLFIFSKKSRIKNFVIYSAIYLSILSILMVAHRLDIGVFSDLFYTRDGLQRASGLIGNPNYFAYFSFCIFVLLQYILKSKKFLFILSFLIFIVVLLTLSRGVLMGVLLFLIIKIFTSIKKIILFSLLLIVVSSNISTITTGTISEDLFNRTIELEQGGSGRSDIWEQGYELWSTNTQDLLIGMGFNQFQKRTSNIGIENTVHNSYLRVLYEFGLLGFIIIFSFYISIIYSVKWGGMKTLVGFCVPFAFCWGTNDFFLVKETFVLMSILLMTNEIGVKRKNSSKSKE